MKKQNNFTAIFRHKGSLVWFIVTIIIMAMLITVTVLENTYFESIIQLVLGGPTPIKGENSLTIYEPTYSSKKEGKEKGDELNVNIAEEGFTLLLNEDDALPLKADEKKVSVFGKNSVNLVLGGSGSGGISGENSATIYDGLEEGGIKFNPVLKDFYEDNNSSGKGRSSSPKLTDGTSKAPTLEIGETPAANYTSIIRQSFLDYNDAAIVVISRIGGESWDLPRSQSDDTDRHYLQLDRNEYELLDMVVSRFNKVIVLLNTLTSFQCDFIAEYNNTETNKRIDAVLWIGGPGTTGAKALGNILNGSVNPSGKTVDIYSSDFSKDPTWQNFGDNSQNFGGENGSAYAENGQAVPNQYMVAYEEGIYMGYRYYETRGYIESVYGKADWYNDNVIFPFGHGLSYTTFSQEIKEINGELEKNNLEIIVEVKNTGKVAGKDVIQLYVSKPYYDGGIEKPYVELVDFAKTDILKPDGAQTVKFKVSAYDLSSYDFNDANANNFKGYELERGKYSFYVSANSHVQDNAYDSEEIELVFDMKFEKDPVTRKTVENLYTGNKNKFFDADYRLDDVYVSGSTRKGMSRTDFNRTFPVAATIDEREYITLDDDLFEKDALNDRTTNNPIINEDVQMPVTGAAAELKLRDLLDLDENSKTYGKVDFNDERWEIILNSLMFEEMKNLVNNAAFQTIAIESIGKNLTNDSDGPIGFVNFMPGKSESYKGNTTFASEIVIGSTWNKDLAYQMGKIVGENGLWGDVGGNGLPYSGWYAPAVNLHRNPFAGRNFEYYSEDPVLSGKLAVNVINGCATKGVYTDLKHFALNDQETNRSGIATFCTEQALRELYLKPFEIAVKGNDDPIFSSAAIKDRQTKYCGSMGIMSSFNRIGTRWTGGDYRLITQILRVEWGFKGLVISDYKTDNSFMDSRQMLYAGNDLILASLPNLMWTNPDSNNAHDVKILRDAVKNILFTVANSNSVQIEITGYRMEWWRMLTIVLDCIIPVALAAWGFFSIRRILKLAKRKETEITS